MNKNTKLESEKEYLIDNYKRDSKNNVADNDKIYYDRASAYLSKVTEQLLLFHSISKDDANLIEAGKIYSKMYTRAINNRETEAKNARNAINDRTKKVRKDEVKVLKTYMKASKKTENTIESESKLIAKKFKLKKIYGKKVEEGLNHASDVYESIVLDTAAFLKRYKDKEINNSDIKNRILFNMRRQNIAMDSTLSY